jgi:hypothetical protein
MTFKKSSGVKLKALLTRQGEELKVEEAHTRVSQTNTKTKKSSKPSMTSTF